jgi:hypothetical protein
MMHLEDGFAFLDTRLEGLATVVPMEPVVEWFDHSFLTVVE